MRRLVTFILMAVGFSLFGIGPARADHAVGIATTDLNGQEEVPPGDPDGSGFSEVITVPAADLLCYFIIVDDITLPASAAHIHFAPPGVAGPIVVPLSAPGLGGASAGCTQVEPGLLGNIHENPEQYYVNVHNADYPGGAVRGQLESEE